MIETTECYVCGGIEDQPAGMAVAVDSKGRPMVASLCTDDCVKRQAEACEAAFDDVDIIRFGYGFPAEVVYGGLGVWLHKPTVKGLRRFDPDVTVPIKCSVCENYTEIPTYKNATGQYLWPATNKMYNGGALYPYNVFADGRKNPKGGQTIVGLAACSHGCATIMATESAFRPDGSPKRNITIPKLVDFADVYDDERFGVLNIDTGVLEYETLFSQIRSLMDGASKPLWSKLEK